MSKRYVKHGTYKSLVSEFIKKDMRKAKVTVANENLKEGADGVPSESLADGLRMHMARSDIEGVKVTKDGDTVLLEKTG